MENKTTDNLIVCSLNCEGINHSKDFINNFLTDNACDYLVNNVNSEFVDCIYNIENVLYAYDFNYIIITCDFNYIIITCDFNTSFSRDNAQSKCLSEFLVRNNLFVSWEHPLANGGNTYNNSSLGHHSFIDHFFVSKTYLIA